MLTYEVVPGRVWSRAALERVAGVACIEMAEIAGRKSASSTRDGVADA